MKRPSFGAICLALVPFLAMCFSVSAWDRVYPIILGLPFNLFWLLLWIVLTSVCMWGVYCLEAPRIAKAAANRHNESRAE
jgi:membrane protein required for beta-lactamase induction